jgi:uncharacterized membrane protein
MGGLETLIGMVALALLSVPALLVIALVMLVRMRGRLAALERRVADLQSAAVAPAPAPVAAAPAMPEMAPSAAPAPTTAAPAAEEPTRAAAPGPVVPPPLPPRPAPAPRPAPRPAAPDPATLALRAARRWLTEGNVPVKVGMLVLFAGVAALLKYASDQGWLRLPIELRLAGVASAALAGLVFAWRQRERRRSFALSLQGGAVGVLLLTVFAAARLYRLLPMEAAFALSVVLVAALGVLAVVQNARALAVFGLLAGFLAPLWLSTGEGNHVALFGYYAVLNLGIFAIAWRRAWRLLNVLGFAFTFGIGALWGVLRYRPEHFGTTEPYLLLFFALYLALPLLFARLRAPGRRDAIDGCLLFGTPLVAFSLQAGLLDGARLPLAFNALGLAALYAVLGAAVRRSERLAPFVLPYAVLAVGFATLAVPLALSAEATGAVFALEGAGLAWLGVRQGRRLPQASGALLQLAAAVAFAFALDGGTRETVAVANGTFMAALLLALAGFASAWTYHRAGAASAAGAYYAWGLAWWLAAGAREVMRFAGDDAQPDALLAFAALTALLAGEVFRRERGRGPAWTLAAMLAAPLLLAWVQRGTHGHPLGGAFGALAWFVYALGGMRALTALRQRGADDARFADDESDGGARPFAHVAWLAALGLALSLTLEALAGEAALGQGWRFAAGALPWLALAALVEWRPMLVAVPFGARFEAWRDAVRGLLAVGFALTAFVALFLPGDSAPLPYAPLLNPLDLAQIALLGLLARWAHALPQELRARRGALLAGAGLAFVTAATLRAAHHWAAVPWDEAMFRTGVVQTALTVVWSALGVAGWVLGSRRGARDVWLGGALLMAVVLAKLVLLDRQHLGNLLGIVSFLAYGLLCTAVGYLAPVPPRSSSKEPAA